MGQQDRLWRRKHGNALKHRGMSGILMVAFVPVALWRKKGGERDAS
jgi:hypothetical protein